MATFTLSENPIDFDDFETDENSYAPEKHVCVPQPMTKLAANIPKSPTTLYSIYLRPAFEAVIKDYNQDEITFKTNRASANFMELLVALQRAKWQMERWLSDQYNEEDSD